MKYLLLIFIFWCATLSGQILKSDFSAKNITATDSLQGKSLKIRSKTTLSTPSMPAIEARNDSLFFYQLGQWSEFGSGTDTASLSNRINNRVPYSGATKGVNLNGKYIRNYYVADNSDTTKRAAWSLTPLTTSTVRTITIPDRDLTLNHITTNTTTNLTGILKGNGSTIAAATAGTDYQAALTNPVTGASASSTTSQIAAFSNTSNQISGTSNLIATRGNNSVIYLVSTLNTGTSQYVLSHVNLTPQLNLISYGSNHTTSAKRLGVEFRNEQNGYASFWTNNLERLRIQSDGNAELLGSNALRFGGTGTGSDYAFSICNSSGTAIIQPRVDATSAFKLTNAAGNFDALIHNSSNGYLYRGSTNSPDSVFNNTRKWITDKIYSLTSGDVTVVDTSYNAATNLFPSTGSGIAGAVKKADWYRVGYNKGGTLGGVAVVWKSTIVALVDNPGQTAANWDIRTEPSIPVARLGGDKGKGYIVYDTIAKDGGFSGGVTAGLTPLNVGNILTYSGQFRPNSIQVYKGGSISNSGTSDILGLYNGILQFQFKYNGDQINTGKLTANGGINGISTDAYGIRGASTNGVGGVFSCTNGLTATFATEIATDAEMIRATNSGGTTIASLRNTGKLILAEDLTYKLRHAFLDQPNDYTPAVSQNVYTKITPNFTTVENQSLTIAGDSITIITPGHYYLSWNFTLNTAVAGTFSFQIRKNNVVVKSGVQTINAGSNSECVTIPWYFTQLIAGDDISFYVTNTANNNDPTMNFQSVFIEKKHDNY